MEKRYLVRLITLRRPFDSASRNNIFPSPLQERVRVRFLNIPILAENLFVESNYPFGFMVRKLESKPFVRYPVPDGMDFPGNPEIAECILGGAFQSFSQVRSLESEFPHQGFQHGVGFDNGKLPVARALGKKIGQGFHPSGIAGDFRAFLFFLLFFPFVLRVFMYFIFQVSVFLFPDFQDPDEAVKNNTQEKSGENKKNGIKKIPRLRGETERKEILKKYIYLVKQIYRVEIFRTQE